MQIVKRIKNLWTISKFHPETIGTNDFKAELISEGFEGTKHSDGSLLVRELGDGKAEFLGEGTEAEFVEQQRIDNGEDKWYKRIFRDE